MVVRTRNGWLIHRSAWKENSRILACTGFCAVRDVRTQECLLPVALEAEDTVSCAYATHDRSHRRTL
jgi:hypothetical protein